MNLVSRILGDDFKLQAMAIVIGFRKFGWKSVIID